MLWFYFALGKNAVFSFVLFSLSYVTIHQYKGNYHIVSRVEVSHNLDNKNSQK